MEDYKMKEGPAIVLARKIVLDVESIDAIMKDVNFIPREGESKIESAQDLKNWIIIKGKK